MRNGIEYETEKETCCGNFIYEIHSVEKEIGNDTLYYCDNENYYKCDRYFGRILAEFVLGFLLLVCIISFIYFFRKCKRVNVVPLRRLSIRVIERLRFN